VKISREAKTGILVVITIALFIYGFNMLKGRNIFSPQRDYYAIYSSIDGLVVSNPVTLKGFKVGQVRKIYFHPDGSGRLLVMISIHNDDVRVNDSTIAKIISSDLLGSKAVELQLGNGKRELEEEDTLRSGLDLGLKEAVNKQIEPIKRKAEELLSTIDSVMTIVQSILDKEARSSLTESFESVKTALGTLEKTALKLDKLVETEGVKVSMILTKVDQITGMLAKNNEKIASALNNLNNITDSIAKSNLTSTINNTNLAIANANAILEKINKGDGTIGMMLNDKKLYEDLDAASKNLASLLADMEKYPGRYFSLFRKKDKPPKKS